MLCLLIQCPDIKLNRNQNKSNTKHKKDLSVSMAFDCKLVPLDTIQIFFLHSAMICFSIT